MRRVSVVIPTKNAGELFREVLGKVRAQLGVSADLVVVDSGSEDQTLEIAADFRARIFRVQPVEFNHGATRDYGIEQANEDIVVLLTQDASLGDENSISTVLDAFEDEAVAGVYVRQVARENADVLTKRNLERAFTGRTLTEVRALSSPDFWGELAPFEKYRLCNFDNVCSAVRRRAWENNRFGRVAFAEDIVWSRKVLFAGWKIAYVGSAFVVHSHDRSLRYDYQRTYLTHRILYQEYGLSLVPTLRDAFHGICASIEEDVRYVRFHERSRRKKFFLLLKLPFLSIASVLGQYAGCRAERLGIGKDIAGI